MTIYSIRTSMGRELWWTTSRRRALEVAEQLDEPGRYVHSNGCVGGFTDPDGLRAFDLPVAVYKCSQVQARTRPTEGTVVTSKPHPGGMVGGVPAFNAANRAYVERSNEDH